MPSTIASACPSRESARCRPTRRRAVEARRFGQAISPFSTKSKVSGRHSRVGAALGHQQDHSLVEARSRAHDGRRHREGTAAYFHCVRRCREILTPNLTVHQGRQTTKISAKQANQSCAGAESLGPVRSEAEYQVRQMTPLWLGASRLADVRRGGIARTCTERSEVSGPPDDAPLAWRFAPRRRAQGRNRTADTGIFSPLLYRLSYLRESRVVSAWGHRREEREGADLSRTPLLCQGRLPPLKPEDPMTRTYSARIGS